MWCWGANTAGQLGLGDTEDRSEPAEVALVAEARAVVAGSQHTCAIVAGGRVLCWGSNDRGQLGADPSESDETCAGRRPIVCRTYPAAVEGLENVAELALGGAHSCARTEAGEVYCWGSNDAAQLGLADEAPVSTCQSLGRPCSPTPRRVAVGRARRIVAGFAHTCALLGDGSVHCWGENSTDVVLVQQRYPKLPGKA